MYRSPIYAETECLRILLEYGEPILFKKQFQGLGCNESFFDRFPNCKRRVFGHRKNSLLKRKLIMKLRSRGKKTSYYTITPLGIAYLCAELPSLSKQQTKRILDNLRFFYESKAFGRSWLNDIGVEFDFSKVWDKLIKIVEENKLHDELHKVCNLVKIASHEKGFTITCSYPLLHTMLPIQQYIIFSDDETLKIHSKIRKTQTKNPDIVSFFTDIYGVFNEFNQRPIASHEIDMVGLQYWISLFILYAFHFNLVKTHSDDFNSMLKKELENNSEVKGKKTKKIYDKLNKIGLYEYDVLIIAKQFRNHLKSVMDQNLRELEMLEDAFTLYQSGPNREIPLHLSTVKRSKKLSLTL